MRIEAHHDANLVAMRTTLNVDDDVMAEVERLRREEGLGLSEAINTLARAGMAARPRRRRYRQRATDLGLRVDVTNIGDVLELLDED